MPRPHDDRPNDRTVGVPGGFQIPVPRWTVPVFGVIALLAISLGIFRYFYPIEPELISVKQANDKLREEVLEYNKHIMEQAVMTLGDTNGMLKLAAFEDGCLLVSRKFAGQSSTRLLVEPRGMRPADGRGVLEAMMPTLLAEEQRCLNQHPGRFTWGYGNRRTRCWVEVWRSYEDGCMHIQLFNACDNTFDTNPDGTPRVIWTRCQH